MHISNHKHVFSSSEFQGSSPGVKDKSFLGGCINRQPFLKPTKRSPDLYSGASVTPQPAGATDAPLDTPRIPPTSQARYQTARNRDCGRGFLNSLYSRSLAAALGGCFAPSIFPHAILSILHLEFPSIYRCGTRPPRVSCMTPTSARALPRSLQIRRLHPWRHRTQPQT